MENNSAQKRRMAVLVGCNYPKTKNELHGCINDILAMRDLLVNRFGFDSAHIQLLTDAAGSKLLPTGLNIKNALSRMVDQAEAGDVLFFHYSGHGTRIPSVKPGDPFRQDEAIVPCDFNLITDVDFRQLVNRLPKGASFTILSDSCHSGGLIDKEKEQIGPNSLIHSNLETGTKHSPSAAAKVIPYQSILHHLSSLTNIHTSDIGTHLLELFGGDSSLKFRLFEPEELLVKEDDGVLLSGCQANETSADMSPNQGGEKAYGAFSNAVQMVFKEENNLEGKVLSNRVVVMMAREVLNAQGFVQQHPCLYCSDQNADAPFLCHQLD